MNGVPSKDLHVNLEFVAKNSLSHDGVVLEC